MFCSILKWQALFIWLTDPQISADFSFKYALSCAPDPLLIRKARRVWSESRRIMWMSKKSMAQGRHMWGSAGQDGLREGDGWHEPGKMLGIFSSLFLTSSLFFPPFSSVLFPAVAAGWETEQGKTDWETIMERWKWRLCDCSCSPASQQSQFPQISFFQESWVLDLVHIVYVSPFGVPSSEIVSAWYTVLPNEKPWQEF